MGHVVHQSVAAVVFLLSTVSVALARPQAGPSQQGAGVVGGVVGGLPEAPPPPPPPPGTPVRVGGAINQPTKTKNVPPVYPAIAQTARVQGVVILEATISPTGQVESRAGAALHSAAGSGGVGRREAVGVHTHGSQRRGGTGAHDGDRPVLSGGSSTDAGRDDALKPGPRCWRIWSRPARGGRLPDATRTRCGFQAEAGQAIPRARAPCATEKP